MVGWSKETPDHLTKDHLTSRPCDFRHAPKLTNGTFANARFLVK